MTDAASVPERLRLRIVALVSAVLPSVAPIPPALRKVAGIVDPCPANNRRAHLAALEE